MKIRILLVDETAFVRDALKRALRTFLKDVELFDAINGHRAIAVLRSNKIDLIICECDMEEMSGAQLLEWTRNDERSAKSLFIAMSDGSNRDLIVNTIKAGASDFLAKPFTPDDVQKKVVKQLARLGYKPKAAAPSSGNSGFGSVAVLSGAAPGAAPKTKKPKAKATPDDPFAQFKGHALLHIDGQSTRCSINELSKGGIIGSIVGADSEPLPRILAGGVAEITHTGGQALGSLNVYIYAMQAAEQSPDANTISMKLRFTNNPPDSIGQLSEAIAKI